MANEVRGARLLRAILTDVQFWIPVLVLVFGIGLLIVLHRG
jgi:hypothetical protein